MCVLFVLSAFCLCCQGLGNVCLVCVVCVLSVLSGNG